MGKRIPKKKVTEYVSSGGVKCPHCDSTSIEAGETSYEGHNLYQLVSCQSCNQSWHDRYVLVGVNDYSPLSPMSLVGVLQEIKAYASVADNFDPKRASKAFHHIMDLARKPILEAGEV